MAVCNHLAPNGEKSLLYDALEQKYGPEKGHDYWTAIRTEQFKNKNPWSDALLDPNKEPTLKWAEDKLNLNIPTSGFVAKNKEQSEAISGIQDFIKKGNPKQYFTLEGKAGTGKTTLVQEAIAPFIKEGQKVLVTALAHKAKLVLQDKLEDRFGKGRIVAKSIAGALGMNMDMETGKFSTDFENQFKEPPIAEADIIIADEASMINEDALAEIMSHKNPSAKVIFLGDIGQLPPIRENSKLQGPSPIFAGASAKVRLVERVRQGEESPILPYADKFWDNSQSKAAVTNPTNTSDRSDTVNAKGALVFSKTMNEILPQVLPMYKEAVEQGDPNRIKTVVYRNDTRNQINIAIRKYIFGDKASEQITKGELMMFQDNYTLSGRKEPISNSTEIQVTDAKEGTSQRYGYKVWKTGFIGEDGKPVQVDVLDDSEKIQHNNDVAALFAEAKAMPKGQLCTLKLKEAWGLKRAFAPLDYSYAITSHKSQGSTYDAVVVHAGDIMSVGPISPKEKSQSIYTALTRAKTSTIVVDGGKEADKQNIQAAMDLARAKPQDKPQQEQQQEEPSKVLKGQMTYDYGSDKRPDVSAESTIQAIRMGERTATTRYDSDGHLDYWKGAKVGDVIKFTGKNGETVDVRVTKPLTKLPKDTSPEEWSKKEGWSTNYFNTKVKSKLDQAHQLEYQYINPIQPKDIPPAAKVPISVPAPVSVDDIQKVSLEPTDKIKRGVVNRESEEVLAKKIQGIYEQARLNPNKQYNIDYDYKSDKFRYQSGYTAKELANLFDTGDIPSNIHFSESFERLINNSSKRILESIKSEIPPEVINRNEEVVTREAGAILLPKKSIDGKLEGYFSSVEHQDIIDSAMFATHTFLNRDPNFGANAIIKTFKGFQAMAQRDPASNFRHLFDNRVRIADDMLDQMGTLGYKVDQENRNKILEAVSKVADLKGIDAKGIEEYHPIYDTDEPSQDNTEFMEAVGHGLKDWGEVSFEHDPKDTASAHMKMFIAMQPDMDRGIYTAKDSPTAVQLDKPAGSLDEWATANPREVKIMADQVNRKDFWMKDEKTSKQLQEILQQQHPILPKKNFMGLPKMVDFEANFQDVLQTLSDSPIHDFDTYMNVLTATNRPNLLNLVDALSKQDQQLKNEFARLVSMQYTNFAMMLFNRTEDENGNVSFSLRPLVSNRYSQLTTLIKNWREQQKLAEITKINEAGQRVIDVNRAKNNWVKSIETLSKLDYSKPENLIKARKYIQDVLRISGISMSDDMMKYLFTNMEKLTKGTSLAGGLGKQFSMTQDGQPNGMFSAFVMKMAGLSGEQDINDTTDNKLELENRAEMNNPLYTENTTMQILAKVAAQYTPVLHSGTSKSTEGKDIWDYSMHTKLSHLVLDMKEDWDNFKAKFQEVDIAKNNILLDTLERIPQYRDKIKLMYMDGMKPTWGKRGTVRGKMSDREQLLMSVALFQNQGNAFNKIPKSHYISLTHADKTTTPIMMNMPKYDFGGMEGIPKDRLGTIGSTMYNIFRSEYVRIVKQDGKDFNDSRYNKGKNLFYFMPEFNRESMQKMVTDGFLTDKEFKTIWMNGDKLSRSINKDVELPVINKILNKIVEDRIQTTKDAWSKNGITTEDSNLFDKEYVRKLLDKNGVQVKKKYTEGREDVEMSKDGKTLSKQEVNQIAVHTAAKDYSLNYFIHDISMSQLFYGDPALTFKAGANDMESVDLTMKEYGKRLAKDIAPGLDPYFRPEDKQFKSITLADHNQTEKYLDNLRKIAPSYTKVNATDAQEFTTVAEHLKVMYANGQISSKIFNEMLQIASKGGYYEFKNPAHLDVIMQPMKPVYAGQRPAEQGAILEDYIKSSSIPLYPPATKGLEIDGLRTLMEKNDIARAPFESAKKIGAPTKPLQLFGPDGSFKEPSDTDVKGATQMLDRSNFRIQQEVPYDEEKAQIKIVSQMNKLITEGIADITNFKIGDKTYTGTELRTLKESIRKDMINDQYDNFLKSWGIDTGKIMDKGVIYDKLIQLAKNNNNFTKNEIISLAARDGNNNIFIPLQYNTGADKFESMLMSMVKDIAQVKMPGKSFVQASSVGWTFKKQDGLDQSGIIWTDGYNGEPLKTTRIENGEVKPAQVMVPFSFLDNAGLPRKVEDYMTTKDGRKFIDTTKIPKELLQLIGARIPNQGHSSMAAIEIVGFIPKNMGDTIIVPAAFTKQMGADFDVDKLYTYRRPYVVNPDKTSESTKVEHDNMVPDNNLRTMDMGDREGTKEDEAAKEQYNQAVLKNEIVAKGGEKFSQVEDRVIPTFRNILQTAPNNTVIVTHSSILKLMTQWDHQGRPDDNRVDRGAYLNRETKNGDVVPFKSEQGTVWVVRHGQTDDNVQGNYRTPNTKLTGEGIDQAREVGQTLKSQMDTPIPKMILSDLPRTVHTGNLINDEVTGKTDKKVQKLKVDDSNKNDYFNVHWSVLTHPDMVDRILKPLDKPDLKNENEVLKAPRPENYNYFDHINQLQDFQNGKDAKMLVALTSLSVTFNSLIQDKGLQFVHDEPFTDENGRTMTKQVQDFIRVKDEHTGKELALTNLSGNGKSNYTEQDGGPKDDNSIRSKGDNHQILQNAAVDNAKDRSLDNLNISPNATFKAIDALIQLETENGEAVNVKYATRLLTQPIIKDFTAEMKKGNDSLSESYDPNLKATVLEKLRTSYTGEHDKDAVEERANDILFDPQTLKKAQGMDPTSIEYAAHQIAALNLFERLDQIGSRKSELQSYFNQDTQGAGANILTALDKADKMNRLDQSPIANASNIYRNKDGKITEAGFTAKTTTGVATNILTQILPYDKYAPLFSELISHSGKQSMSIDNQRDVLRAVRSFTYNSGQHWWRDANVERGRLFYTQGESLSLARRVDDAKRTWGKDNYFLQRLDPVIGDTQNSPDFLEYQAVSVGRIDEQNNNRAWLDMLMSKIPEERALGEDLLRYSYLTGGVQDQNSFVKFVPNAYIANTDFGNMLKSKGEAYQDKASDMNNPTLDMPGFIPQFLQHYPERAFNIERAAFGELPAEQNYPEAFRLDIIDKKKPQEGLFQEDGKPREFISYRSKTENKWILFHSQFMPSGDVYYVRIDTLGNQYTDEYDGENNGMTRSIFTENRSLAEVIPDISAQSQYAMAKEEGLGNYYKGASHFEALNIVEGETPIFHIDHIFQTIASDPDIPEYLRSVADVFHKSLFPYSEYDAKELLGIGFKPEIKFDKDLKVDGNTTSQGTITLRTGIETKSRAAEVFIHEHAHQRLLSSIMLAGYDDRVEKLLKPENVAAFKAAQDKFARIWPDAVNHIRELDKIRLEAFTKLKSEMGETAIIEAERKINNGIPLNSREAIYYGLNSMQEFAVQVMTDADVQKYLNNIERKGGTILNAIWNKIVDIIKAVSKSLGKWVKKDSALHQALYHAVSLHVGDKSVEDITGSLTKGKSMQVQTQSRANDIKELGETVYNRKVNMVSDELGHTITYGAMRKAPLPGPIGKIAGKLKEQLDSAYRDISKGTDEDRIQARVRYNELRQDYNDLIREKNISQISQIARKQLDWVDKILQNRNVNAATTQAAIDTANIWGSMVEIMYGKSTANTEIDPTLAQLQAEAITERIRLINTNAVRVVTQAFDNRIPLTNQDFDENLKEVDKSQALFLTLARVKPKLVSGIGMLTKEAADNRDEHFQRVHDQLVDIRKQMAKLGIKAEDFMQKDTWSLKDRLSNKWHEHISSISKERDDAIDRITKTEKLSDTVRRDRKQVAWQKYWNEIRKSAVFVDTRTFFDSTTGNKVSNPKVDAAYNTLVKNVGSKDYADELVEEAHQKYQKYIQERKVQLDHLDANTQLTDEEAKDKTLDEQLALRKQKILTEANKWVQWNSPHEFLNKMNGKSDLKYVNDGDRWLSMAPRFDQPSFYDPEHAKLMANKQVEPIFTRYKSLIQEMTSYLPPEHSEKLPPGFLPIVSMETVNQLSTMIGKLRNFSTTAMNALTSTEQEEYARMKPDEIPIMYTKSTKYTEDEENRSKDLIRIAEVFSHMALHYRYMAPVLDQVNVAESIVKEANRQRVAGESEGPVLRNALDTIKYNKDKLIFNKPNPLEGKLDEAIYDKNLAKNYKIKVEIKELTQEKTKINEQIRENEDNGEWDNQTLYDRVGEIYKKLDDYDQKARYIYASKLADSMISINQMKALAYNPFSALSNFTFAAVSAHVYATGRSEYDPSHLRQAMGIATHAMKNYYTFGAAFDGTARKIRALMERSQVMTELTGMEHQATRDQSHLKEALSPFNWQKSGDYYAKGSVMIAMMLKKEIEVEDINTGEKKTVRLWDALDNEGKIDTTKYMDNPQWYHEDVSQQKEWNRFRDQMRGVATIVFGNQDKNSPLMAKKEMLWRLAGQFRMSWFPEGLNTRFGSERFDPLLGRDVKGRYRSFGTLGILTSAVVMIRSLLDILPGINIDRFKGLTDKEGNAIKDIDMENMRRNFAGLAWSASITGAILMLRALYDDTHKGKKKSSDAMQRQLLINMLIRNQQDLMMYSSPNVWDNVTGNLIPATTIVTDTWRAMKATGHYLFGDTAKDKHAFETWMLHITKATPILNNINKANYMLNRDLDVIQR